MGLLRNSTTHYCESREDAVAFASEKVANLHRDSALIMIIDQEKSGAFYVTSVTGELSADTSDLKAWPYLEQLSLI